MTPPDSVLRRHPWSLALPFALACIAWFLYQRNVGLHPTIFADEWYYSKMARLTALPDAIVPSYLYLWIFGFTKACGDGYMECVRAGNLALFMAAAPFVYAVTRRFTSSLVAFAVAVLSALAPLNVYTAYFMPETTYYFGFCVLSWVALTRMHWHPMWQALAVGTVLGVMSLVKVHALFLLPALCPFLVYASWHRGGPWLVRGLVVAAATAVFTVVIKFGLGWLIAGEAGLSLLGPFYQGAVNASGNSSTFRLLAPAFINGRGHLMALAILYGVPLAILVHELLTRALRPRSAAGAADPRNLLHIYTFLTLGAAAGVTVLYTATLDAPGSREILRLHLRYYSFVFPLLCIVAAAAISPRQQDRAASALPWLRWVLALALGAVLVFSLSRLHGYALNTVDGPDIGGIDLLGPPGMILIGLQLALLLAWAARLRAAPLLFVFVALPASLAASHDGAGRYLAAHRPPGHADTVGKFMRQTVPPADRGQVVVAGTDMTQIMRVQFHLDHPDSVPLMLETPGPIADYLVPINKKWMVLLGDQNQLPDSLTRVLHTPHYTVVRLPEPDRPVGRLHLSAQPDPQFITAMAGLSHAEAWGRWSDAKQVVIHFAQPLPRRVGVVLNARAYDINATLPFTAHVGGVTKEFRVGWHLQEIGLHFDTDGSARTLVIDVPQPVSPAERGSPGDPRKLGIGIAEITITDGSLPAQATR
ncbi:hypothetical protein [Massilia sp. H6]|uniref:DUF7024 domain-containing protein n=1 Tax=Massilia sp. H6 TaxID=2970464 RepID=UPI002167445D|nr:hypothetical protein [Massilia sp. H6]UVW28146.1 hypothetical protein NRS07_16670 [Massilia sp. H6]